MKILLDSYSTAFQNKAGGVQQRMRKIASLLAERGIQVDYFDKFSTQLKDYDVLHVFMLTGENHTIIKAMKALGKRIVISSVIPNQTFKPTDRIRKLIGKYYSGSMMHYVTNCANMADAIICETPHEAWYVQRYYGIPKQKTKVIPNGVPENVPATEIIYELISGKKDFVLQVGRFDENKNQLRLIRAMKNTDTNIVFIGGPNITEQSAYYDACLSEADDDPHFHFLGWHSSSDGVLASAYAHANILVLPSFMETFGMVLLEAGIAGAKLAMSNTIPIGEYPVFENCRKFNPHSVQDIRSKVLQAIDDPIDPLFIKHLKDTFSWDSVIDQHIELYRGL